MPAPSHLRLHVGASEPHRVDLTVDWDGNVDVHIDGTHTVRLRPQGMVGGYVFDVGQKEKHRIEAYYIDASPPGLAAKIDGAWVRVPVPPEKTLGRRLAVWLPGIGLLAGGILALAGVSRAAWFGFGIGSVVAGGLLVLCGLF